MRAVMPVALPEVLRRRKQTGADRFDEMWEGTLHLPPAPSFDHQNTASGICAFFREVWAPKSGGFAVVQANVSTPDRWDRDYRIPDVAVMTRDARPDPGAVYVLPTVVFEVRSPDDETFEKLSFYAAVGVGTVVVVERDTKAVQVFSRADDRFVLEAPNPEGWLTIRALEVEVRSDSARGVGRLTLRLAGDSDSARIV